MPETKEVTYDDFAKLNIEIKNGKVVWNDKILKTSKEDISVDKINGNAKVS